MLYWIVVEGQSDKVEVEVLRCSRDHPVINLETNSRRCLNDSAHPAPRPRPTLQRPKLPSVPGLIPTHLCSVIHTL